MGENALRPGSLHGPLEQIAGRPNHFRRSGGLEEPTSNDLREVRVGRDRGLPAVPNKEVLDLLPAGQPRLVEDDRVVFGADHHDHHGDVRNVIDRVGQCPEERDVLVREVGMLCEGELPDVVEDLIDQDQDWPPDRPDRLGDLGFVGEVRLIALVERVIATKQPPKEAFVERDGRAVIRRVAAAGGHVVAREDDNLGAREVAGQRPSDDLCRRRPGLSANVSGPELDGVGCQMPEADHRVRLAAAHGLIEPPERRRGRVQRTATEPDSHPRDELDEVRTRMGDLAVVRGIRVRRPLSGRPVDRVEERHLHVVDDAGAGDDLTPEADRVPPGRHHGAHCSLPPASTSKSRIWSSVRFFVTALANCSLTTPRVADATARRPRTVPFHA